MYMPFFGEISHQAQADSGFPAESSYGTNNNDFVLSIENVWAIPLLRDEKISTRLSLKYANPSVKLFYDHFQGEFINKYCQHIKLQAGILDTKLK